MNKVILLLLVLLASCFFDDAAAQNNNKLAKPVKVKFSEGEATIDKVEPYATDWKIEKGHRAVGVSGEEEQLFASYWTVPSLQQYRALFYGNEYPVLTEDEFRKWRLGYNNVAMRIKGKVYFEYEGYELCALQYNEFNKNYFSRETFFIKKVNGKWYPVSREENKRFRELKPFFKSVKPEGIRDVLADEQGFKNKRPKLKNETEALMKKIKKNGKVLGETTVAVLQEEATATDANKQELAESLIYTDAKEEDQQSTEVSSDRSQHMALVQYMDSLKLQPAQIEEVLGLIVNDAFLEAAYKIESYARTGTNHNHVMKIREIYGEDKIIVAPIPHRP